MPRSTDQRSDSTGTLSMGGLVARWGVGRHSIRKIPFRELPYEKKRTNSKVIRRRYRVADVEAYEARTPVAPWEQRRTAKARQRRAQGASPVSVTAYWEDVRVMLAQAREAREKRARIQPKIAPQPERRVRRISPRDAAVREMRSAGATFRAIRDKFGISDTRIGQILFWTGGDPGRELQRIMREKRRAERAALHEKEVQLGAVHRHALVCDRMIDGLRICARDRGYVPAPFGTRFRAWVGFNAINLIRVFGSLDDALRAAGLPVTALRRRPIGPRSQAQRGRPRSPHRKS
jgi:hypothetical protein